MAAQRGSMYTREYLRGFFGAFAKYAAARPSSAFSAYARPGPMFNVDWPAARGERRMSAGAPRMQRPVMRAYDPAAKYRPPPTSAEAKLNEAGATALNATPAVLSAPVSATIGGMHGLASGYTGRRGAVGTALQGLVGAGTAYIPGMPGVLNASTGAIESIAGDVMPGSRR